MDIRNWTAARIHSPASLTRPAGLVGRDKRDGLIEGAESAPDDPSAAE